MATMELSLALLGPPVVRREGTPVTFDTRKATALLALLAVTGREHTREQLADLLWPEADSAKGRASLRRTLSVTAAAMGQALIISRAAVALDPGAVWIDVQEFGDMIGRADTGSLERAVRLYRDDFLTGFTLRGCPEFEEWQESVAEELRQSLARGLQRLVTTCIAEGALDRAAGHARRWLQLDPLHEPAHQAIIRLHGWAGDRSAAMRQYRSLARVLDRDLAVRPLPETTRLYDDVRAGRLKPPPAPAVRPPAPVAAAAAAPAIPQVARPSEAFVVSPAVASPAQASTAGASPVVEAADGVLAWPLVGRSAELEVLRSAWRGAGRSGRVVAIAGQAGTGKTRLTAEVRTLATQAGATVLAARCHDGETALPFVLAADLLRTALAIRPELPDVLPAQTAAMAGRLVPALAAAQPDTAAPALDSPVAVTRLYVAIADILQVAASPDGRSRALEGSRAVVGSGPAGVVVVEDVHWADSSSLGLLAYLVRRLADWPLLLVLSWQTEQSERLRVLRTALSETTRQGLGETIEPGPLDAEAIAALLAEDGMPPIDVTRLLTETRGLPMLVREYVEALRTAGTSAGGDDTGDWWPPASVRDLLRTRLQAVGEPARQMLTAAAVLGSDNDADLLRAVSGRGEDEIVEAIDEALSRSLLTENAPPAPDGAPSYGFPYDALRRTAYESATLARRRLLHGRAASVLTRRYERDPAATRAATVAGHLQLAGRDTEAAQWWWRAAEVARELYAHAEARAHLNRALALGYPQLPGRVALGDVLVVLGRYREALAEFETAAAVADGTDESGDPAAGLATRAGIEHKLADVHHRLGDWDLAEAHLAVVSELVEGTGPGRLARAEADRAVVAYRRGAAGQAAEFSRAALADARAAADPGATAQALNVLGMLAARAGEVAAAETYLRDSLAEARRLPEPGASVAALNNLARLLAETGRGPEALTVAAEALDLGIELGDQHRVAALHTNMADLLHADGQREAAMTHLKEAARRFASVDVGDAPRPEIWTLVEW
jgi:DNA-binding SARP family transcriptional activator/tetratricopeptide (TPR) repeat protein